MSTGLAAGAALCASALFAVGTSLQYQAAQQPPRSGEGQEANAQKAVISTVTSLTWLLGTSILLMGFCLHALALHEGPLTVVQPLLVTGLLFALPVSRYLVGGPKVGVADMRWAVVLVGGLALFLVTATSGSQPVHDIDAGPAAVAVALGLVSIGMCMMVCRRRRRDITPGALGIAAGIALAGSAALLKVCTNLLGHGAGGLLGSWQLYALILVGGTGLILSQLAYRTGPLTASLPAINSVNPVVSVLIGWAVFDERFRVAGLAVTLEVSSLTLVVIATVALSRRSAVRSERDPGSRRTSLPV